MQVVGLMLFLTAMGLTYDLSLHFVLRTLSLCDFLSRDLIALQCYQRLGYMSGRQPMIDNNTLRTKVRIFKDYHHLLWASKSCPDEPPARSKYAKDFSIDASLGRL